MTIVSSACQTVQHTTLMPVRRLVEGASLQLLGKRAMAIHCLEESLRLADRPPVIKDERHAPAYAAYELGFLYATEKEVRRDFLWCFVFLDIYCYAMVKLHNLLCYL